MNDDITATLAPKSDQLDAIDLMGKPPRVFTITKVDVKTNPDAEQPVSVHFAEFPRVWRPNVTMRRVLSYCWSSKSSTWIGRQVELYCEDGVRFGNDVTGGTRISRLSHLDGPRVVPVLLSKGKSGTWSVEPLTDEHVIASLRNEWKTADAERKKAIEAQVAALTKSSGAGAAPEAEAAPVEPESSPAPDVDVPDPHDGNDPWADEKAAKA